MITSLSGHTTTECSGSANGAGMIDDTQGAAKFHAVSCLVQLRIELADMYGYVSTHSLGSCSISWLWAGTFLPFSEHKLDKNVPIASCCSRSTVSAIEILNE